MAFFTLVERCAAQRDALVNRAAITDLGSLTHHHAHRVVKKHAFANLGTRVDLDTRQPTRDVRDKPARPLEAMRPAGVRPAVQHYSVKAGVAGEHFPGRTGGRVAVKNALNVGADSGEHGWSLWASGCLC